MNRFLLPAVGFALLAIVLWIGVDRSPEKGTIASPLVGRPAPDFSLPLLSDDARRAGPRDWRGRWYLLNVWGTWCPGCRDEHDMLLEVKRGGRVPIIGLNWKDEDALAIEWLARLGNPYELVAVDRDGRAAIDWGVYGAPETFLVNPQGIVAHKHVGPPLVRGGRTRGAVSWSAATVVVMLTFGGGTGRAPGVCIATSPIPRATWSDSSWTHGRTICATGSAQRLLTGSPRRAP